MKSGAEMIAGNLSCGLLDHEQAHLAVDFADYRGFERGEKIGGNFLKEGLEHCFSLRS